MSLVVTLVVLLFARDVSRSAHGLVSLRQSENRTFSVLANTLIGQENAADTRFGYLLIHGQSLSRPVFSARLLQLADQLPRWSVEAELLRRPDLSGDVNVVLSQLTQRRVADYQAVFDAVAHSLQLPWTRLNGSGLGVVPALASLLATDQQWNQVKSSLAREPGHVVLSDTTTSSAVVTLTTQLATLAAAPSLGLTRGIGIAAVSVSPAPLPAPRGDLVLPAVGSVQLGVAVSNAAFVNQRVTLAITFTPTGRAGSSQVQTMVATLGPTQSFGFVPVTLVTAAGERAILHIVISGAPSAPTMTTSRTYRVTMSPSGSG